MRDVNKLRRAKWIALATLLWFTVGIHPIHPLVHEHLCHHGATDNPETKRSPETLPPVSGTLAVAPDAADDCDICKFEFTFHAQNPAPPPAVLSSDAIVAVKPSLAFLPPSQSCLSPFSARAPPF